MSVSFSASEMQELQNSFIQKHRRNMYSDYSGRASNYSGNTTTSIFESEKGNYVTDGKDDGKIGVWSAIGNILEGGVKSVFKAVKGAFTDSEGNLSLGQTLKTAAVGTLCVLFPPAGVVLGAVGVVTGAAGVVTGVSNALNAETDAEAKDMWEQVGEGALTLGLSVAGTKASYNAVATQAAAANPNNVSMLSKLGKNATFFEKVGAFCKDSWSCIKGRFKQIRSGVSEQYHAIKDLNSANKAFESQKGALSPDFSGDPALITQAEGAKVALQDAQGGMQKTPLGKLGQKLKSLKPSDTAVAETAHRNVFGRIGDGFKNIGDLIKRANKARTEHRLTEATIGKLSAGAQKVWNALTDPKAQYKGFEYNRFIQDYGYNNVLEVVELLGSYGLLDDMV